MEQEPLRPIASLHEGKPLAPGRDPCLRCGVPGFKGCDHYAPCGDVVPPIWRAGDQQPRVPKANFPGHAGSR